MGEAWKQFVENAEMYNDIKHFGDDITLQPYVERNAAQFIGSLYDKSGLMDGEI